MPQSPVSAVPVWWHAYVRAWLCVCLLAYGVIAQAADVTPAAGHSVSLVLNAAVTAAGDGDAFPVDATARRVTLPDQWWTSRPREDGPIWYRLRFDTPPTSDPLLAAYIERVCSNAEVRLNGVLIYRGGSMTEPVTRNCFYAQLVTLPSSVLQATDNVLDIKVMGYALQKVASRQRSGGMSEVKVGPYSALAKEHARAVFWNISLLKIVTLATSVLGAFLIFLGRINKHEVHLTYFGLVALMWNLLTVRTWWQNLPFDNIMVEMMVCVGFAILTALTIQFLLSYSALRSRVIEAVLLLQCLLVPLTLALAGPQRLFTVSSAWYLLLVFQVIATVVLYLYTEWHARRGNFWPMAMLMSAIGGAVLLERAMQLNWVPLPPVHILQFMLPVAFVLLGSRQLKSFGLALKSAEEARNSLERRVAEATAEMERNYVQMAELRVEQVTEKERKRIAGDLHDDLGAKLLTIVHTSESERISTLAREALEEMRLSVRGLTGKPLPVADALADWRAETVSRLGQAGVEIDWRSPTEDISQMLSARAFVQTTRILREAVSNVIKHSGASHCKVRCTLGQEDFVLVVQDNGKGIPMELDGKLDRGHGMASMKHRAKQMQGQCLVESGPGYGTVIRLTLPLGTA